MTPLQHWTMFLLAITVAALAITSVINTLRINEIQKQFHASRP